MTEDRRDDPYEARESEMDGALERTVEALRSLPTEAQPPVDLWPAIRDRMAENSDVEPVESEPTLRIMTSAATRRWWQRSVSLPRAMAASLVLASAIGLSTWLATRDAPQAIAGTPGPAAPAAEDAAIFANVDDVPALADYDQAIVGLRQAYELGKDQLAPETVEVLERSLASIDDAIEEARMAIESDPASVELRRMLYKNMNRKLDVLRRAAVVAQGQA